jgi:hypothetical protein
MSPRDKRFGQMCCGALEADVYLTMEPEKGYHNKEDVYRWEKAN